MRAVVQRVKGASVSIEGRMIGRIERGLLVYAAAGAADKQRDIEKIASKVANLRIFPGGDSYFTESIRETGGEILLVSQFTLYGDCRKGRRPSFDGAMPPDEARGVIESLRAAMEREGLTVETGEFGAMMEVESVNDGPVTILLDSEKRF